MRSIAGAAARRACLEPGDRDGLKMTHADTIVALSSSVHAGLRAILRLSGSKAFDLVDRLSAAPADSHRPGWITRRRIELAPGFAFDVTLYAFRAPRSSTGEDVIELHLPASPVLVSALLKRLVALGARQAEPGEFTARAFFNGKLDLTAAEGVAATISASNRAELDAARQLLGGELARRLTPILDQIVATLALIEVGIDFTDEDVTFLPAEELEQRLVQITDSLRQLVAGSARIERLSHEPRIVLTGRPNAGKSTLLNALAGSTRAVVSNIAGTTRDALSAQVALPRGFVTLVDVAGIENSGDDIISTQMQESARSEIQTADAIVLLIDSSDPQPPIASPREPNLVVHSKIDLAPPPLGAIGIDAIGGVGLETLRRELDRIAFGSPSRSTSSLALNARHVAALTNAIASLEQARAISRSGNELVASELRVAIDQLGGVLGNVSPDDVLGKIFSSFCIGK